MLFVNAMADPLYFNLWFSSFEGDEMMPHALSVMRQFPFSTQRPGVTAIASHPVSWNEATIFEKQFKPGVEPAAAVLIASDLLHEDYAYVFEAFWDLWSFDRTGKDWVLQPERVRFIVRGVEFDEGAFEQEGHIQIDFGPDSPFLQDQVELTSAAEAKVRANVQKLVEFTTRVEKSSGTNARLLWSESDENFAQKLLARLQKLQ